MIGVDISQYNSTSDFVRAKNNGLGFAILRAVSTNNKGIYIDTKFENHYKACKAAGIPVGVYVYTYAQNLNTLKSEIAMLDKAISGKTFEFPIILDIEDPLLNKSSLKSINTENVKYFCNYYENRGYYAGFYSMPGFYSTGLYMDQLRKYDFWLAHWTHSTSNKSKYIALNSNTGMWQYTDSGSFIGIGKAGNGLDVNVSYKDYPNIIKNAGLNGFKKQSSTSSTAATPKEETKEEMAKLEVQGATTVLAKPRAWTDELKEIWDIVMGYYEHESIQYLVSVSGKFDYKGIKTVITIDESDKGHTQRSDITRYLINTKEKALDFAKQGQKVLANYKL